MSAFSVVLRGSAVMLEPLAPAHAPALARAATDGALWELPVTVIPKPEAFGDYVSAAIAPGDTQAFATIVRATGEVVGTTRYFRIETQNRTLEIGYTWLARSWQRTHVNTECKYLLLRYAFESLEYIRVQFTTDERNAVSRAALLRIGAVEEGLLRNERILPDGRKRTAVCFSIIDSEWPDVRARLERRLRDGGIEPAFSVDRA